jgi:hypothetical protein
MRLCLDSQFLYRCADVLAGESLLDKWPDARRGHREHRRFCRSRWRQRPRPVGLAACEQQFRGNGLEELLGGPALEHLFQHAAVIGVRQAAQGATEPALKLSPAGLAKSGSNRTAALPYSAQNVP